MTFDPSEFLPTDEAAAAEAGISSELVWSKRRYFYLKRCNLPEDEPQMIIRGVLLDSGWRTMFLEKLLCGEWVDARDLWWQTVQECDYWDMTEEEALAWIPVLTERYHANREAHERAESERLERERIARESTRIRDGDVSGLAAAAIALHEVFTAFVRAGFTEDQSLRLTTRIALNPQR